MSAGDEGEGAPPPGGRERPKLERDIDAAVGELGRLATGVVGHVLGAKAVGKAEGEVPSVSPVVDEAIDRVGDTLGRILHAVGDGIAQHPTAPDQAVKAVGANLRDPTPPPRAPGWSGLSAGIGALARGLGAVGERVADELAGKKPAPETPPEPPPETPESTAAPEPGAEPVDEPEA